MIRIIMHILTIIIQSIMLILFKHSNGLKMKKEIQKIWEKKEYYKWLIVKRIKIILLNYKNIELKIKKLKLIGDKIVA